MKKVILACGILLFTPFFSAFSLFQLVPGIDAVQIKRVTVSRLNPQLIYVASKNSLYKSHDKGETFQKVAVFIDEEVQQIFFDPYLASTLYIAASRHIYKFREGLEQLYTALPENVIYAAAKHEGKIYVGTSQGLYFASADTLIWKKSRSLSDFAIYYIEPADKKLYLATDGGLYRLKGQDRTERLFVTRRNNAEDEEENPEDETETTEGLRVKVVKVDISSKNRLWLGTNQGLYLSEDSGSSWRKLYLTGISDVSVNCLAQTRLEDNALYLGTAQGFFTLDIKKDTARQIFEGISSNYIYWVDFTPQGNIYVATSQGLFRSAYFTPGVSSNKLTEILNREPSIREVQQAALYYNQVHPDKIKQWREALKYRALFPSVSLDYDKTIYGTAGGSSYDGKSFVGPRDWGVSFSWDTGDLIWNSYEDDVDTRARLNTQLRLDILDEINRVYFERLRLKGEIVGSSLDDEELFTKELRLEELTAILDGYTGGFFSQRIKELNEN